MKDDVVSKTDVPRLEWWDGLESWVTLTVSIKGTEVIKLH